MTNRALIERAAYDTSMDYPRHWHKRNGHVPVSAYLKMAVPDWFDWNAWLAQNTDKDCNFFGAL